MSTVTTAVDILNQLHTTAADIEAMGGKVTDRFARTRARWIATRTAELDPLAAVVDALTGDDDPDPAALAAIVAQAQAHGTARANPQIAAGVWQTLAQRIHPGQRAEWAKVTTDNYRAAAEAYNQAAKALTTAVTMVDPDAQPEALMGEPPKVRNAWVEIPTLAAALDRAERFLTATAREAGVNTRDDGTRLGLVATIPDTTDRRTLWAALDGEHGRAGTWGTLLRLGATLTAPANPGQVEPYRRPKPIERRYLRTDVGLQAVDYDPERDEPKGAVAAGAGIGRATW